MPTFASIGLHPDLQNCLVSESISSTSTSLETTVEAKSRSFFPIATPLALLQLHPQQQAVYRLVGGQSEPRRLTMDQVQRLRHDVAVALIEQSPGAQYRQRIRDPAEEHSGWWKDRTRPLKQANASETDPTTTPRSPFIGMLSAYEQLFGFELERAQWRSLSTGSRALDRVLQFQHPPPAWLLRMTGSMPHGDDGGIPFGYITQLSGPPASGKTQLVLSLLSSAAMYHHAWYLCSGSARITAQRLHDQCRENKNAVLERTTLTTVHNAFQVLQRLQALESRLLHDATPHSFFGKPIVLIVDSCSGCLGTQDDEEAHLVSTVGATLRRLTRQYHLATILINGTVSNQPFATSSSSVAPPKHQRTKPALGRSWNDTVPDLQLWCEPTVMPVHTHTLDPKHPTVDPPTIIRVTVTQHPAIYHHSTKAEEKAPTASFMIGAGGGISDVPSSSG